MTNRDKLIKLYALNSKHSNYQILPKKLENVINSNDISVRTRFEAERFKYIVDKINVENKSVLDIGGNSGYFTFEFLEKGASHVHYYEGNKSHFEFVRIASKILKYTKHITLTNEYFTFHPDNQNFKYDIILLLNVLHHIGEDYGNKNLSLKNASKLILEQINTLANTSTYLILQLGFNWKGNVNLGLFKNGTKLEMINFLKKGIKDFWKIENIGIAKKNNNKVTYEDINEINIKRDDQLGEFLNRPIFILKSKITFN